MRIIVLGATGTVGRSLVPILTRAGHETLAVGRNALLLEHLHRTAGCRVLARDVVEAPELPDAEWLIDLTFPNRRHPREVITRARAAIRACATWVDRGGDRRLLHTGSFVVAGYHRPPPRELSDRYTWDDAYVLAKSAAERELRRLDCDRLHLLRLGNVVTPSSLWGQLLLRATAFGHVRGAGHLDHAANLSAPETILGALSGSKRVDTDRTTAGFTWREVIDELRRSCGDASPLIDFDAPSARPDAIGGLRRLMAPIVLRSGALLPRRTDKMDKWRGWRSTSLAVKVERLVASDAMKSGFPPEIPQQCAIENGARDQVRLGYVVNRLTAAFNEFGYDLDD